MDWHIAVGIVAGVIQAVAIVPYIRDALKGKTRPNVVSWLIWTAAVLTMLFAQVAAGASWSVFLLVGATIANFAVLFICWLGYGYHKFGAIEAMCLALASAALILWYFTSNPLVAMALALSADAIAYLPTYAKAYRHPASELPLYWWVLVLANVLAIISVTVFTAANLMAPIAYVILNFLVLAVIFVGARHR